MNVGRQIYLSSLDAVSMLLVIFHLLLYVLFVFALYLLPLVTCAPGDIVCGDGSCVDIRQRCDRIFDCLDGTDERDCGKSGDTGNIL
jgi:hypothetical protein